VLRRFLRLKNRKIPMMTAITTTGMTTPMAAFSPVERPPELGADVAVVVGEGPVEVPLEGPAEPEAFDLVAVAPFELSEATAEASLEVIAPERSVARK
jgi:hypothetical protein